MTANSFTTVSLDPLLVMVCAQHGTRFHEAVIEAGHWAASMLSADQVPVARWFATRGRPLDHQFAGIPTLTTGRGALILRDALAAVAATTQQVVPAGDHDILISQVTSLHLSRTDLEPTVYFRSAYGSWSPAGADAPTI
jgi:flavin reductase (DIM6/NTAB) family NADH-FMN oxidoreductase RutF